MELFAVLLGRAIDAREVDAVLDGQITSISPRVDNHLMVVIICSLEEWVTVESIVLLLLHVINKFFSRWAVVYSPTTLFE